MTQTLTLTRPDDWHLHLRDGALMASVVGHTAREFARAIVMPNLKPPVTTTELAAAYRERILAALPQGARFEPLMTLYLTSGLTPEEVVRAKDSGIVHGIKFYPAGATTNSEAGVSALDGVMPALEKMAELGLPFLVHGEVTDHSVDVFDREAVFIERVMAPLTARLPELRVVFEHITTRQAAEFVTAAPDNIAATVTPQHLLMNRNALFQGGIRPHHYCLPVLKREEHRQALVKAVTSGSKRFFLGTDSAPHALHTKESSCGCAGIYSAHAALAFYAEAFEAAGALDQLEAFASFNGPDFYRLPRNTETVTLVKEDWTVPASYPFGEHTVVPLRAGETLSWRLAD
ncbi:dihydroorotase [Chitinibacteraceae bacterium HSL-7]